MTFSTTYSLLWLQFPVMDFLCKILGSMDMANWVPYLCCMRHGILLGHGCMRVPAAFFFKFFILNNWIRHGHSLDTFETWSGHASWKKKWQTNPAHRKSSSSSSSQMFLFFFITDLFSVLVFVFVFVFLTSSSSASSSSHTGRTEGQIQIHISPFCPFFVTFVRVCLG